MMNRDDLVRSLKQIRRAVDDRLTFVRCVIGRDGTIVRKIAHTIHLPKEEAKTKK